MKGSLDDGDEEQGNGDAGRPKQQPEPSPVRTTLGGVAVRTQVYATRNGKAANFAGPNVSPDGFLWWNRATAKVAAKHKRTLLGSYSHQTSRH